MGAACQSGAICRLPPCGPGKSLKGGLFGKNTPSFSHLNFFAARSPDRIRLCRPVADNFQQAARNRVDGIAALSLG
jgi:hypothetical protein